MFTCLVDLTILIASRIRGAKLVGPLNCISFKMLIYALKTSLKPLFNPLTPGSVVGNEFI